MINSLIAKLQNLTKSLVNVMLLNDVAMAY
jgi:hypothetical protein